MSATKVLGTNNPVATGVRKERTDREATVVEVEGRYALLEQAAPATYCPSGYTVETSSLASTGDGMGKLTVRCVKYESGASFTSERETFRIDMVELQYKLEDHPHVKSKRDIILKWLATEEAKRVDGNEYKYQDKNGDLQTISDVFALKFCEAFMAGITSFNRYYPVIEKISVWKNPPGMSQSGRSFTGGSPTFSANVGKYDAPPLTLNGFPSTNWFKSKDSWVQNADTTWTRTEQWTYTPESSSGSHAWIYTQLT